MEQKFAKHAKKQRNVIHNSNTNKQTNKHLSIEKDSEITQMAQLVGKDIKNIFHLLKKIEENISMIKTDMEDF